MFYFLDVYFFPFISISLYISLKVLWKINYSHLDLYYLSQMCSLFYCMIFYFDFFHDEFYSCYNFLFGFLISFFFCKGNICTLLKRKNNRGTIILKLSIKL